jgi:hypothetical protein
MVVRAGNVLVPLGVILALGAGAVAFLVPADTGHGLAGPAAQAHVRRLSVVGSAGGHWFAGYQTVTPEEGRPLVLRLRPGGSVVASLRTSMFGGPVVAGVVRWRGAWAGVESDALPNGVLGWVDTRTGVALKLVRTEIRVDLSARTLGLYRNARLLRRFPVAIGSTSSPTPTGRYAVAEKLPGPRFGRVYGCCILGLTAHQDRLPAGADPNDTYLIGIHGGSGIGQAVSLGCLHMTEPALRYLMRSVPLGTPVVISP